MPDRKFLICMPVSLGGYVTPGSLQDKCVNTLMSSRNGTRK